MDDIYQMIYSFQNDFALVILLFAVIFGFILSFAVGANDSANSWGTPVGAGTVSFGIAVIFGSIMETLGRHFYTKKVSIILSKGRYK